jgi:two-component sensor histidine kinase
VRRARYGRAVERAQADAIELLREVHHRVKNNLQVVQSLLALEASRLSHPDVRRVIGVIQDRLRAVALVHDHLQRSSSVREVALRSYVVAVIDGVRRSQDLDGRGIHVRVRGSQGLVGMNDALRVGLMLNELVSNAVLHGLSGRRGGEICASVSLCARRRLRIKVSNTGAPLPVRFSPPIDRLGLAIVGNIARHSGGRLWWSRRPRTSFHVELKQS